jgi:hypothetical protein
LTAVLTSAGSFTVPGLPEVVVYRDNQVLGGFYAVSQAPRIVVDDGVPELALTVHGRREAGALRVTGGILTLTTTLSVPQDDLDRLPAALTRWLAQRWPEGDPPRPRLFAPEWVSATVRVRLAEGLELVGTPSMTSDNRCSFSEKLTAPAAKALRAAWARGLPDAVIDYRGELRGAPGGAAVSGGSSGTTSSRSSSSSSYTYSSSSSSTGSSGERVAEFSTSWSTSSPSDDPDRDLTEEPPAPPTGSVIVDVSAPLVRAVPDVTGQLSIIDL